MKALPVLLAVVASHAVFAGQAVVSWKAPTKNMDGTRLTNLAGFTIYYGPSTESMKSKVVAGRTVRSRIIKNLGSGTWYFGITAFNTLGAESEMSNIASKSIP